MTNNDLYKIYNQSTCEYTVYTCDSHVLLPVKNQRGKLYVNFNGKQVNIKDIPEKYIPTSMPVYFGYVFEGLFQKGDNEYYDKMLKNV